MSVSETTNPVAAEIAIASKDKTWRAVLAIGTTVLFWAMAFPAIHVALHTFKPTDLAFLRFFLASAVIAIWAILRRPQLPKGRDWIRVGCAGALSIAGYNVLLNMGQQYVSAGMASLLVQTGPIFAIILAAVITGDRLRPRAILGIAISFTGITLISVGNPFELHLDPGALYVIGAAFCFALSTVIQRPLFTRVKPLIVTAGMMWVATALLSPFAVSAAHTLVAAPMEAWGAILFLGFFPSLLAYFTWSYALSHFPVSRAVSCLYLVPPTSLMIAYLWLGDMPSWIMIIGGGLALGGVVLANSRKMPAK